MHCFDCDIHFPEDAEVCSVCGNALETDPDRYFKAGMDAMANGDISKSIDFLNSCINLNPSHISGRYNLGISLSLDDRCDEALQQYAAIIDESPDYPGIYTAMGQAAFGSYLAHLAQAESQCNAMISLFMTAIDRDPDDVDACFSLGNAYIALDNAEKAMPWIQSALSLHPDSPAIYFTLAKALKMLGKDDEAAEIAKKCMQLSDPKDPFWEDVQGLFAELHQAA